MQHIDLQVNGYAGVDFNSDALTADELGQACQELTEDGVSGILATIITAELPAMCRRLRRIAHYRQENAQIRDMIIGFHVEGPFISPASGYIGAHPSQHVQPANPDTARHLLNAGEGLVKLITLAPECDAGLKTTRFLSDQGIKVAAGHCNPTLDLLKASIQQGLSMVTHLGNGCPIQMHRHDNFIQRALSLNDPIWYCFIADGIHLPPFALKNYLRLAGLDRSILVTDAISAAKLGAGDYSIGDQIIKVDETGTAWASNGENLAGSTATMPQMRLNSESIGISAGDFDRMTQKNPIQALA